MSLGHDVGMDQLNEHRSLPDFLGIGAQKAGTSWLFQHLSRHPDIWMPGFKELHFFDQHLVDGDPKLLRGVRWRFSRLERQRWSRLPRKVASSLIRRDFGDLAWHLNYHFRPRSLGWYQSLFRQYRNRIVGELTPEYAIIDASTVKVVKSLTPDARIVFLMRDPVERAWSQVRMRLIRFEGRNPNHLNPDVVRQLLLSEGVVRRSRYMQTIETWLQFFPEERFYVGFMEDIVSSPRLFLEKVFRFLGVEPLKELIEVSMSERVHAGVSVPMPSSLAREIAREVIDDLRQLNLLFGGHTTAWLQQAERLATART